MAICNGAIGRSGRIRTSDYRLPVRGAGRQSIDFKLIEP